MFTIQKPNSQVLTSVSKFYEEILMLYPDPLRHRDLPKTKKITDSYPEPIRSELMVEWLVEGFPYY